MKKLVAALVLAALSVSPLGAFQTPGGGGGGEECPDITEVSSETCNCSSLTQMLNVCHGGSYPAPGAAPQGYVNTGMGGECESIEIPAGKCSHFKYTWTGVRSRKNGMCFYTLSTTTLVETDKPATPE